MRTRRNLVTGIAAAALVLVPASAALTASAAGQPAGTAGSVPGPAGRHTRLPTSTARCCPPRSST
jgi:hypothetical protein